MDKQTIFQQVEKRKQDLIDDICTLVQIDSTRGEPQPNQPFGKGPNTALEKALEICRREGLKTKNVDGYMGYGCYGESEEYIGIIGHLDVVEVGDGWLDPPFSASIHDGRIWGRGALDDKGPLLAAMYGMLALKDLGIEPKTAIHIIFGTNEETGMEDMRYFLKHEKAPIAGFTPDNKFPAIYGERGRAVIEVWGAADTVIPFANEYFMNANPNGDRLGIAIKDEHFGEMKIRNKILLQNKKQIGLRFSLSYPSCDLNEIVKHIQAKAIGLEVKLIFDSSVVLHNPNSWLVQTMEQAYEEATDTKAHPTTTTGGTYAHVCHTIIPYGPSFPGQNGIAHQPNEWVNIEDLIQCTKIYAWTLYRLCMADIPENALEGD
ncbi:MULTISPECIES: Sapep family Mn(2+)-dependent dipeptidase [Terrabacteria group]|uniref:Sapep family Mn(2+)-dependent dipeptidase n=1 Tax=Bacillati TaxID=1783272 RepID=UPI00193A8109|nr:MULTISPECIES: Sapep family Mn(2+)-dependent dipeptidase [Terrabacteria group]MBW9212890.1 Sapep family Mn(2+)-dependent dipeptidase [Trueperella sp. zg.1013]QRG86492.1 Sapep family Mn(2+)-dependent dipeptidase [Bulleidia sp. zg-1006]